MRDAVFGGNEVLYNVMQIATATTSIAAMDTAARYGGLVRPSATSNDPTDDASGAYSGARANGATQSGSAGMTACTAGQSAEEVGSNSVTYGPMNEGPLDSEIANSFRSGTYTEIASQEETTLYRGYGGKAGELGSYWTRTNLKDHYNQL